MELDLSILLKEYGLEEEEIKVYLFLVAKEELTAYKIAKEVKIHRSTCYDILERLISKGFVSSIEEEGKKRYNTNDLNKIISKLKDRQNIIENIIPGLKMLERKEEDKIQTFQGIDGQKSYDYSLLKGAKEGEIKFCYIIGNTYSSSLGSNLFLEKLIREFKDTKLNKTTEFKAIWDESFRKDKIIKLYEKAGKNKFMKNLPSKVGTVITNIGIAFLYTRDKPYVIGIKNKLIAEELKVYFDKLWCLATF